MKVLLACTPNSFREWADEEYVGRLLTPPLMCSDRWHPYTAMDNFAFANFSHNNFMRMLLCYKFCSTSVKWVAVPDVVGDCKQTQVNFDKWHPTIASMGYGCAFVLQDGQSRKWVPWQECVAVFLGGSTEFKLSNEAMELCKEAKDRGKLVHIGRVNSIKRVKHFLKVADSFDGLTYSKYSRSSLRKMLNWLKRELA